MSLPETLRTTSFRLAIAYTVLFVISVLAIMGTTYLAATAEMRAIVRSSIDEDIDAFRAAYEVGGAPALTEVFRERAEGVADDRFLLLTNPSNGETLGNVPAGLWAAGWADRKIDSATLNQSWDLAVSASRNSDWEVLLLSFGETFGPYRVMAARNSHLVDETQEIMISALLWGSLATSILALVGGYAVSVGPTRRVDEIASTTRRIVGGRLDLRLPVSPRRDELDRLASDINVMLARIEVLMDSLRQVSTDIAHDLRTPLSRMRQRLEVVRGRATRIEEYETAVDGAMDETDAIIETFNALLRIAQIEAGARRARFAPLDLTGLVRKLGDVYEDVAADAGHVMSVNAEEGVTVNGDGELLTQALVNLIENAINHVDPPANIELRLARRDGAPVIEVSDNGPGVPEDEREKIFRRLYRVESSRTTPGNGLGLALVAAIVDLHDGRIEALDNAPGLTMRISLPT